MRYVCLTGLLIVCSCVQRQPSFIADEKKQVVAEVKEMMGRYYDDIRKEGLAGEFKYLDSTNDFFWVPPGFHSHIGYDSVAGILRKNAGGFRQVNNSWIALHIVPLTNELASYTGRLRSEVTDTSGKINSMILIESGVVVKRSDGWKLLNGQTAVLQ